AFAPLRLCVDPLASKPVGALGAAAHGRRRGGVLGLHLGVGLAALAGGAVALAGDDLGGHQGLHHAHDIVGSGGGGGGAALAGGAEVDELAAGERGGDLAGEGGGQLQAAQVEVEVAGGGERLGLLADGVGLGLGHGADAGGLGAALGLLGDHVLL